MSRQGGCPIPAMELNAWNGMGLADNTAIMLNGCHARCLAESQRPVCACPTRLLRPGLLQRQPSSSHAHGLLLLRTATVLVCSPCAAGGLADGQAVQVWAPGKRKHDRHSACWACRWQWTLDGLFATRPLTQELRCCWLILLTLPECRPSAAPSTQ